MNRFFWRIFLWFWLSMMLVTVAMIMLSPLLTRTQPRLRLWEEHAERWIQERVETEAGRLGHCRLEGGVPSDAVCPHSTRHHHPPTRVFVFDAQGRTIGPDLAPAEVRNLGVRALSEQQPLCQRRGAVHLYARPVRDLSGREFVVVGALKRPPMLTDVLDLRSLLPRMALLGLVGALLIFLLARHLSTPISALRSATQALAAGDLKSRVAPMFSRRGDEIGGLARDFNRMAGRVEALLKSRSRLLRDVSHELRSPLARLSVALELSRRQTKPEHLERIGLEIDRMEEMISGLLEYEKLEGKLDLREQIDLRELILGIVSDARYEVGRDPFVLDLHPAGIRGNRRLLASALENLIRNALFFSSAHVEISLETAEREVLIRIADEGPGVPEEELEKIFEAFYRVEEARERNRGGTGMGLAIARRAVAKHGGAIRASNRPGGGLEIEIRLPLSVSANTAGSDDQISKR